MKIEVGDLVEVTVVSKISGYFGSLGEGVLTLSTCDDMGPDHRIGIAQDRITNVAVIYSKDKTVVKDEPAVEPAQEESNLLVFKPRDPKVS